jgi:hypothetical protein
MSEYRFERFEEKHYADLVCISKSAFNIDPGLDYYHLKNATSNFGATHLGFIAYHIETNEPAAFYGVYSYPISYNGKHYSAVQSGDTMTHVNHGGKGLFTTLAKLTYELAEKNGAQFVFGFPNQNSYPGFVKKLNWVHNESLVTYKIKVMTLPLMKIAKRINLLRGLFNFYFNLICNCYPPKVSSFNNSASEALNVTVNHNTEFVNYKSFNGNRIIKVAGVHVWIKADGFLVIGDIEKDTQTTPEQFLNAIKKFSFLTGADTLLFNTCKDLYWDKFFSVKYKAEQGAALGYLNFGSSLPLENLKCVQADLDTF